MKAILVLLALVVVAAAPPSPAPWASVTPGHLVCAGYSGLTDCNTIPGYLATVTTDSTTARTLTSADCGTVVKFTNGSAVTVTLPNSLSVGCQVSIVQAGAGQVTVSAAGGASLRSPHSYTKTYAQYSVIAVSVNTNSGGSAAEWYFTGDGA